jgi:hypothetical protein
MYVGETGEGKLMIIPVTGGSFTGETLRGRVLPGGADWSRQLPDGVAHVHARYWIETDDGAIIMSKTKGFTIKIARTQYIRTTPRFTCDINGKYAFLTRDVYAAKLCSGGENAVDIRVYHLH